MEHDSQIDILESQIRELYGRVVWSHKTQEKCADMISRKHSRLKYFQIGLAAITTTGVLVAVFGPNTPAGIVSAICSTLLFGLNAYSKDYDLGEIAQKHSRAASDLWNIREKYLSLLTDLKAKKVSVQQVIDRRDEYQENLHGIYIGAPRTITKAYAEATKALKINEEMTLSDSEVDMFLPTLVRKGAPGITEGNRGR